MKAIGKESSSKTTASAQQFDVHKIRGDFPILKQLAYGKPLVYLDNAATSQKPQVVIDALMRYYTADNSNIHRGVHLLSERATHQYEESREKVRQFINAAEKREIIFVRGTTEALNLVAHSYGRSNVNAGDEVLITALEHHSNIVPWQILCSEKAARLRVVPISDDGEVSLDGFAGLINERTKLISIAHVSNALGTINPVREMIELAHGRNIPVMIDGAQAAPHTRIDVQELDCDFYAFSGHKVYGPTGIGVLYGKADVLEAMPPYQGGGDMIASVSFDKTTYNSLPYKFEAGTPNIAGTIGLGAAIDYVSEIGLDSIAAYEHELLLYGTHGIIEDSGVETDRNR
jgi:cysteine desulfurase/selenocysteine lyase